MSPTARDEFRRDQTPKPSMRHHCQAREVADLVLEPFRRRIRSPYVFVVAVEQEPIAPLCVAEEIPRRDRETKGDPAGRFQPYLAKEWGDDDLALRHKATRRVDGPGQVARAHRAPSNGGAQCGGWRGIVADSGGVISIFECSHSRCAQPATIVRVRRVPVADEQDSYDPGVLHGHRRLWRRFWHDRGARCGMWFGRQKQIPRFARDDSAAMSLRVRRVQGASGLRAPRANTRRRRAGMASPPVKRRGGQTARWRWTPPATLSVARLMPVAPLGVSHPRLKGSIADSHPS